MVAEVQVTPDELSDLRAAITALQFRVAEQEGELTSLRGRFVAREMPASSSTIAAQPMYATVSDSAEVSDTAKSPKRTDRRVMLKKMGAVAAGVTLLSMMNAGAPGEQVQAATPPTPGGGGGKSGAVEYSDAKTPAKNAAPLSTGNPFVIGTSNNPTVPTDVTRLYDPSGTVLMDTTLYIENYTTGTFPLPTARIAIAGSTHGPDTIGRTKVGVYGASDDTGGYGVWGNGNALRGVFGLTSSVGGAGVYGTADGANAAGVNGNSTSGIGGWFTGGKANLRLIPNGSPGIPAVDHSTGDMLVDSNGMLFYCIAGGTPGTFRQISGPSIAGAFTLLSSPDRYVDTRIGFGGVTGQQPPNTTQTFQITGRPGQSGIVIPDGAVAIFGTLTAIAGPGALPGSFLTAWGSGAQPPTSNINYGPSQVLATSFVSALGTAGGHGTLNIFNRSDANYLVDVAGYYA